MVERRFGHNGYFRDPPLQSLVINSFTRRENGSDPRRRTKTLSRVRAINLPLQTPHTLQLHPGFRRQREDESTLGYAHFVVRSFLRYVHRAVRGNVARGDQYFKLSSFVWRFVTGVVALNNVEDTLLTNHTRDVVDHLARLGMWGPSRTERLRPYQLVVNEEPIVETGSLKEGKRFVAYHSIPTHMSSTVGGNYKGF